MLNFKTLTAVAALATAVSLGTAGSSFAQNWGSGGGGAPAGRGGGGGAPSMGGGGGGPAMGGAGLGPRGNVFSGAVRGGMGGGGPAMGSGPRVGGGNFTGGPRFGAGYGRGGWQGGGWQGGGWGGGGWHGHRHWRGGGYWPGAYAGAFIGGVGSSYYYNDPYAYDYGDYDEPTVAVVVPGGGGRDDAYCSQRFKSYNPATGTYLGYDGRRHPCP